MTLVEWLQLVVPVLSAIIAAIRRVSTNGGIRWNKRWVNVSHILATLPVGLEPLSSGTWNLFFGPIHLGWLDERDYRIHDHRGRTQREHHLSPIR